MNTVVEPLTVNIIIIVIALISIWLQVKMYRIIPTPAFTLMGAAMVYLVVFRIAVVQWPGITGYGAIIPVFVLLLAHTLYLYQLIVRFMRPRI